jgi:hypothetical protein
MIAGFGTENARLRKLLSERTLKLKGLRMWALVTVKKY